MYSNCLHLGGILQAAALAGRQIVVHHNGVRLVTRHDIGDFARFAGTHIGGGIRLETVLQQPVAHLRAGGLGQCGQLAQRLLRLGLRGQCTRPDAHQHHALKSHLAVFDFGDVL